jgi:hypothetical protein
MRISIERTHGPQMRVQDQKVTNQDLGAILNRNSIGLEPKKKELKGELMI